MSEQTALVRKIWVFVFLTLMISSVSYFVMFASGRSRDVGLLWMWSPGLAAILTQFIFKGSLKGFGWRSGPPRYLYLAALIPLVYSVAIYGIAWMTGLAGFKNPSANLLVAFIPGLFIYCFAALGEEIGWRGFLVPHLIKITSFTKTVLLTWIVWSIWHYPVIIWADYHSDAPRWFDLTNFTILVMGLSAMTAWMRLKSGSIWPPVIWHGVHNLLIQGTFLSMTMDTGVSEYIVDDFGMGVMMTGVLLAAVFLRRGSGLREEHLSQAARMV